MLGQRLKQARLEAGLSQRQLCGDTITRNMLSQIENGSAKPSMDTLRYLAARLGKPMGFFLEEQAVTSPNQQIMAAAREAFAKGEPALELLAGYAAPDRVFDAEYHLLCALSKEALAKRAIAQGKIQYALTLLSQATEHGHATPYYTPVHHRANLILRFAANPESVPELSLSLTEVLLLAKANPDRQAAILDAFPFDDPRWHHARADCWFSQQNYAKALIHYENAPQTAPVYQQLEICCRELGDYKSAYYYAKKQG